MKFKYSDHFSYLCLDKEDECGSPQDPNNGTPPVVSKLQGYNPEVFCFYPCDIDKLDYVV